jgi:hypothetical protein
MKLKLNIKNVFEKNKILKRLSIRTLLKNYIVRFWIIYLPSATPIAATGAVGVKVGGGKNPRCERSGCVRICPKAALHDANSL